MEVDVLKATNNADRLAVACGRGDYMEDSLVGVDVADDDQYRAIVEAVSIDSDVSEMDSVDTSLDEKTAEMIRKFVNRGHFGVLEHSNFTFAVEGISRSCMAQLTRHRHVSFDVQSMRYVNVEDADVKVPPSIKDHDDGRVYGSFNTATQKPFGNYEFLVEDKGVPKEDARFALPIGTKVNLTMTMNLRTLAHIINLRKKANAQWEIRELTEKVVEKARPYAPIAIECIEQKMPMEISP
jgi:thymidylate synthase (FAD)